MVDSAKIDALKQDRGRLTAELKAAGARIVDGKIGCPFHDDKHPSGGVHQHPESGACLYTCHACKWNDGKSTGDIFDVIRRSRDCTFPEALKTLGLAGDKPGGNGRETLRRQPDGAKEFRQIAADANRRLLADNDALEHLFKTRGIDRTAVELFGIGIDGIAGKRSWTLPVNNRTGAVGIKLHRADGQRGKSRWNAPKAFGRDHCFPIHLEPDGPVWVCPGELKGLAVAAVGRAAIGITSGEGSANGPTNLPAQAIDLLRGRKVAIVPDDDNTGAAWGIHILEQLAEAGVDARIVDLGLDASVGLKDVGDWITRRVVEDAKEPEAVAATLDDRYLRADPWSGVTLRDRWSDPRTWAPMTFIATGFNDLDRALGGGLRTRCVELFVGKTSQGKSQVAIAIAVNAAKRGTPVGFLSLELDGGLVAQLVLAQLGSVPRSALEHGHLHDKHVERFEKMLLSEWRNMPLAILDDERWPKGLGREALDTVVAAGVKHFGWKLIIVDYYGLIAASPSDQTDYQSDLLHSATLRRIARRHDVAMLVVMSLRKTKGTTPVRPEKCTIDDVAGAGRLVYDATDCLLVWCEPGDDKSALLKIKQLKSRFARCCDDPIQLRWRPRCAQIEDLEVGADDSE